MNFPSTCVSHLIQLQRARFPTLSGKITVQSHTAKVKYKVFRCGNVTPCDNVIGNVTNHFDLYKGNS